MFFGWTVYIGAEWQFSKKKLGYWITGGCGWNTCNGGDIRVVYYGQTMFQKQQVLELSSCVRGVFLRVTSRANTTLIIGSNQVDFC